MIGVWRERCTLRISPAVSKPSIPGMRTSIRISAKSFFRIRRSASWPEEAVTTLRSGPLNNCSIAARLFGSSSTTRIFAFDGPAGAVIAFLLVQPDAHQGHQLLDVDRLGDVVRGARLYALLAVLLHRFRGDRHDGQVFELLPAPDDADRVVAVELGHH